MQVPPYNPFTPQILRGLKQGQILIVANGELRQASWSDHLVRWLNWSKAARQNKETSEWLIQHLAQAIAGEGYQPTLEAIAQFVKNCHRTDDAFKRLENVIFSHKCSQKIPSLKPEDLIQADGSAANPLLKFLQRNSLHYVIAKANSEYKETALLLNGNEIYIRAKEGISFLDKPDHIALILDRLPAEHTDAPLLKELHELLSHHEGDLLPEGRVDELKKQLELSHYVYQSLQDVRRDGKGLLVSQAYLADGIENFDHVEWQALKPTFREKANQPTYKLRLVTRLPTYALEKTWYKKMMGIMRNFFNFRAHGHSWVELAEPINHNGQFANQQNIYNIGYYFHPLNRYKRFESADPMAYMPIPREQIMVEEIEISQPQYEKAQLYLREVQILFNKPQLRLDANRKILFFRMKTKPKSNIFIKLL